MLFNIIGKWAMSLTDDDKYRGLQRVCAFGCLTIATLMGTTLFVISTHHVVKDVKTCITILELFLMTSIGLLLGTFIDRSTFRKKTKDAANVQ